MELGLFRDCSGNIPWPHNTCYLGVFPPLQDSWNNQKWTKNLAWWLQNPHVPSSLDLGATRCEQAMWFEVHKR